MTDNVIEARGLVKLYGAQRAVNAIDLDIRRGEIFGLLGPNGAGKTATILMLLGLTETSGGTVDVLGFDPVRQPLEVKRRIGYLPDAVGFYDHLTARENLNYTARLLDIPRRETAARIMEAMKAVQLDDVVDKRVSTYSRGMRQRLGIAEIVMKRAEIAILDEPTSGLHMADVAQLLDCFEALLAVGHSLIVVEHSLTVIQAADYLIDLGPGAADEGGRVVAKGSPEQVARIPESATGRCLAPLLHAAAKRAEKSA